MNGLQPFESTTEETTETMPPSNKTITAAAMRTNRITNLRELLPKRALFVLSSFKMVSVVSMTDVSVECHFLSPL